MSNFIANQFTSLVEEWPIKQAEGITTVNNMVKGSCGHVFSLIQGVPASSIRCATCWKRVEEISPVSLQRSSELVDSGKYLAKHVTHLGGANAQLERENEALRHQIEILTRSIQSVYHTTALLPVTLPLQEMVPLPTASVIPEIYGKFHCSYAWKGFTPQDDGLCRRMEFKNKTSSLLNRITVLGYEDGHVEIVISSRQPRLFEDYIKSAGISTENNERISEGVFIARNRQELDEARRLLEGNQLPKDQGTFLDQLIQKGTWRELEPIALKVDLSEKPLAHSPPHLIERNRWQPIGKIKKNSLFLESINPLSILHSLQVVGDHESEYATLHIGFNKSKIHYFHSYLKSNGDNDFKKFCNLDLADEKHREIIQFLLKDSEYSSQDIGDFVKALANGMKWRKAEKICLCHKQEIEKPEEVKKSEEVKKLPKKKLLFRDKKPLDYFLKSE